MVQCPACGVRFFGGVNRRGKRYCSSKCVLQADPPVFCGICVAQSTDETCGGTTSFNGIGTTLRRCWNPQTCSTCGSVVSRRWFSVFFLPIAPRERYRVIYLYEGVYSAKFVSRRIPSAS